jgi:23S rRNA (guanosine2251-2'-O)-methyltransferase
MMAGNSQRRGARRQPGSKKGAVVGSGGQKSKGLRGRGPTPKAAERGKAATRSGSSGARTARSGAAETREGRPAAARSAPVEPRASRTGSPRAGQGSSRTNTGGTNTPRTNTPRTNKPRTNATRTTTARTNATRTNATRTNAARSGPRTSLRDGAEVVAGRNSVVEALRAGVPATALFVAERVDADDRVREAMRLAAGRGLPLLEAPRSELDRMTAGAVHQGLALQVPAYTYAHPDDLPARAEAAGQTALLVALDGVTDPRNLGAVVRSAAAFGAHGVVVPERRSAGMTAGAWKASAGAAARVPVARATNLTRQLESYRSNGFVVVGLSADGTVDAADLEVAVDPLVLVVGSEGQGLSRLVERACDVLVRIPMAVGTESLNAGVAAGIVLYEVARHRAG